MTDDTIRHLAQSDPVPVLTARWGKATAAANTTLARLTADLRELETVRDALREHGLTVSEDLGPIGNAAMSVYRTLHQHDADHLDSTFELPRAS